MKAQKDVEALIRDELKRFSDQRAIQLAHELLVDPAPVMRDWDYGSPGEQMQCWTVLADPSTNSGVVYCDEGFVRALLGPLFDLLEPID